MKHLLVLIVTGSLGLCAMAQEGPIRLGEPASKSGSSLPVRASKVEPNVPEVIDEKQAVQLDPDGSAPWWQNIEDDKPLRNQDENEDEFRAFNHTLAFANRQTGEALARHSLKDVTFADLFHKTRQDYARELVHLEGRLSSLRKVRLPKDSFLNQADKIPVYYEGWMFPKGELHAVCIVFTELPEGVVIGEKLTYSIRFDGYSFKLIRYESREVKSDKVNQWRRAPMVIGKTISLSTPPPAAIGNDGVTFITIVLGAVLAIVLSAVGLSLWFRSGDQRVRQRLAKLRTNPFDESAGTTSDSSETVYSDR